MHQALQGSAAQAVAAHPPYMGVLDQPVEVDVLTVLVPSLEYQLLPPILSSGL